MGGTLKRVVEILGHFSTLRENGPNCLLNAVGTIRSQCTDWKECIQVDSNILAQFDVNIGVEQGCRCLFISYLVV